MQARPGTEVGPAILRRYGEMLQSMAGLGFEGGSAQTDYLQQMIGEATGTQKQDIKSYIDTAYDKWLAQSELARAQEMYGTAAVLGGLKADAADVIGQFQNPQDWIVGQLGNLTTPRKVPQEEFIREGGV